MNRQKVKDEKCKATHDGEHRPIPKMGSKTGHICEECRREIENEEKKG